MEFILYNVGTSQFRLWSGEVVEDSQETPESQNLMGEDSQVQ